MKRVGIPEGVRRVYAEPYSDEDDDVTQWAPCVLADWIVKEMRREADQNTRGVG